MIMEIFSAAVQFFCEKMDKLLMLLTTDLTTFQNGTIWDAIQTVYMAMMSVGLTVAGILIWFGLLQSMDRYAELKRPSVWLRFLAEIILINAVLYYGKDLLLTTVQIGQGIARRMMQVCGMIAADGTSIFHITIPDGLGQAIDSMSLTKEVGLFIVVIVASLWIVISTCGVLLSVYGRLFNLYLLIAVSPLPIASAIGKPTRFISFNFLKTFLSVVLEALVMVLVLYLFKAFFISGFDVELGPYVVESGNWVHSTTTTPIIDGVPVTTTASEVVFGYMAEISFLFLMLFGMLKGTDKLINRIFGV
ncbi:MAG: hypothetical protein IJM27_12650 [Eubacterium sp.]|nr:hypothetical protein [Eubacterium sp.]